MVVVIVIAKVIVTVAVVVIVIVTMVVSCTVGQEGDRFGVSQAEGNSRAVWVRVCVVWDGVG